MQPEHKPLNSGIIIAVAVVISLIVGVGAGYAVGNSKDTTASKESGTTMMATSNEDGITVGGAKMVSSKDIVQNALNAKNVTTLVTAVKAADLVSVLQGAGPFTVFAPNNEAFNKLPEGTVDTLLKPENKSQLANILTYHVVPGTYTSAALKVMAQKGQALTSVQGEQLMPVMQNNVLKIKDSKGNVVAIQTSDVISSNGVTFVIDSVLMP